MKYVLLLIFSFSLTFLTIPSVFADGGGGIECPEISGAYSYVNGSAIYEISDASSVDQFGMLYCGFESYEEDTVQFGTIEALLHVSDELSQELIDEYGCGEKLGAESGPLYVSSTTHFAVVTYSTSGLLITAENIMSQIEQQNLATVCSTDSSEDPIPETDEEMVEELEEIIKEIDEPVEWIEDIEEVLEEKEELLEDEQNDLDFQVVLPDWIKDNAQWWASDQITKNDFLSGIEYLISEGIIVLPPTEPGSEKTDEVPSWVKFNAGWWADGQITDSEFIDGLQYLISAGIISVASN